MHIIDLIVNKSFMYAIFIYLFTFTFSHLADAFIQSGLQLTTRYIYYNDLHLTYNDLFIYFYLSVFTITLS